MAILTGLKPETKKEDRLKQVKSFLEAELEVFTRIEDTYILGNSDSPPIVITFQTLHDKEVTFEKKAKLKDVSKEQNVKYYLNHYLPAIENEKRKRERKIRADAKTIDKEVSYTKQGLKIGDSIYKKKIVPPQPTELLGMTVSQLDEVLDTPTMKGPELRSKGQCVHTLCNRYI